MPDDPHAWENQNGWQRIGSVTALVVIVAFACWLAGIVANAAWWLFLLGWNG